MTTLDRRSFLSLSATLTGGLIVAACGGSSDSSASASPPDPDRKVTLRLGYFPNITHAQPQTALQRGTYASGLGPNVTLNMSKSFNAGPSAMEALLAGAIDATFVGPSPALNAYAQTGGKELRIVVGATSGGAMLIVRPAANLTNPADFAHKKIASPQLANTQDVALRAWLGANGLKAKEDGGNVTVQPTANADILNLFQKGSIDGAWVPEPWATRLVQEAGGKVILDERSIWPNGQFVTTHLVVRTSYLRANPDVIEKLVRAHIEETLWIKANQDEAKRLVNQNILKVTNAALPQAVIDAAWPNQEVTYDPIASSLQKNASDAFKLGFMPKKPDLSNIYDLTALNSVLKEKGLTEVKGLL